MSVISLAQKRPTPQGDIPRVLRDLADKIEAGEVPDMPVVTTCAICLGYSRDEPLPDGEIERSLTYDLYGAGPRADMFTIRGLLLSVATQL